MLDFMIPSQPLNSFYSSSCSPSKKGSGVFAPPVYGTAVYNIPVFIPVFKLYIQYCTVIYLYLLYYSYKLVLLSLFFSCDDVAFSQN